MIVVSLLSCCFFKVLGPQYRDSEQFNCYAVEPPNQTVRSMGCLRHVSRIRLESLNFLFAMDSTESFRLRLA